MNRYERCVFPVPRSYLLLILYSSPVRVPSDTDNSFIGTKMRYACASMIATVDTRNAALDR